MRWNMVLGALVISACLSTQSYGFELLDRMLGGRDCGCQPTACEPACAEATPCGECNQCCPKRCDLFAGLKGLFDCKRCGKSRCACESACEPACAAPAACEPACEPACNTCAPCKKRCWKPLFCKPCKSACAPACEPACAAPAACEPACEPACNTCAPCKKRCKLDLLGLFRCKKSCGCSTCDTCDTCGASEAGCGCGGQGAAPGAPAPAVKAPAGEPAPVPPAPAAEPSASTRVKRNTVASRNLVYRN
jgi:hypothetical protein